MIKVEELSIRSFTTNGASTRWRIWSEDKIQYLNEKIKHIDNDIFLFIKDMAANLSSFY